MDINKKNFNKLDDIADGLYCRGDTGYKEEYVLPPLGRYILAEMAKGRKMQDITEEETEQFKIVNYYKSEKKSMGKENFTEIKEYICPFYNRVVDECECYDMFMVSARLFKNDKSVPERDREALYKTCLKCGKHGCD